MNSVNKNLQTTNYKLQTIKGFSLVEVILSTAIFALAVTAFVGVWAYAQEGTALGGRRNRAAFIAEEGFEAVRAMRDQSFSNITDGTHGIKIINNAWQFDGVSDVLDSVTRAITVSSADVRRKNITATVDWQQNIQRTGTMQLETRLTDWRRSFGNWATPSQQAVGDAVGGADANGIALYKKGDTLYAVIVRNASANTELEVFNVTDLSSPLFVRGLELSADAEDIVIAGDYAVIASVKDTQELQIVDLSQVATSPLAVVGSFDAPGAANARAVAAFGATIFLARNASSNPELFTLSIANPAVPTQLGSALEFSNDIRDITLAQNNAYLYLATANNSAEVVVVSVSNPSALVQVGTYNASGDSNGTAVTAFSTYGILGRADGTYFIFSALNSSSPTLISGGADLGAQITDATIGVGDMYAFLVNNTESSPVHVINIAVPGTPVEIAVFETDDTVNGVAYDFDANRVFIAGVHNSAELVILKPN
ncbi:MAG TPA: hypothetical protein VJB93_03285 [Patescibacteria group bacterium]|nr:hypothetical protein [Patescibacteria group bacterium]